MYNENRKEEAKVPAIDKRKVKAKILPNDDKPEKVDSLSDDDMGVMLKNAGRKRKKEKHLNQRESSTRMQSEVS